jgi:hypothetical protein
MGGSAEIRCLLPPCSPASAAAVLGLGWDSGARWRKEIAAHSVWVNPVHVLSLIQMGTTMHTYVQQETWEYISRYVCLSGHNGICELYREFKWSFLKDENCSGLSQIAGNCSDIYSINQKFNCTSAEQQYYLLDMISAGYARE